MRVGIVSIQHESNTFVTQPTTIDHFRHDALVCGDDVRPFITRSFHEVAGFFTELDRADDIEAVSILFARAGPSGMVTAEALDAILELMWTQFEASGELDGLLVAPHGAGVCQTQHDMDGHWLSLLRQRIGPDRPMICTLDPHANLSQRMIDACDATILYRTNPHLDQRARGIEAAGLMTRTLHGEIRPVQAASLPPIAINIERQHTASEPCQSMIERLDLIGQKPGVLSSSLALGFPYADVPEMGSGFVVVTDDDPALARVLAEEMTQYLFEHKEDFLGQLTGVDEALDEIKSREGPVCLLDMGDNVGGGSAADGTHIAHAVHHRGGPRTFVALCDPQAAQQAIGAGAGRRVQLSMGGKIDHLHGPPLEAEVEVVSTHDGRFTEDQVRHGGKTHWDMGPTAIVQTDTGLTIQLMTYRVMPFSLNQILSCGIDPSDYQILLAKGVQAPIAAYSPVCKSILRVNTPGSTTADMVTLDFKNRRRPLFPFEPINRP